MQFENLVSSFGDVLKPEYQEVYEEWLLAYCDTGCTCFIHPPCNCCTHEGNPHNLEETPYAWESPIKAMVRQIMELTK